MISMHRSCAAAMMLYRERRRTDPLTSGAGREIWPNDTERTNWTDFAGHHIEGGQDIDRI